MAARSGRPPPCWIRSNAAIHACRPRTVHATEAALSVVFLTGAWQKLKEHEEFVAVLEGHRLLPAATLNSMAWLLPLAEALAGVLLIGASPTARDPAGICLAVGGDGRGSHQPFAWLFGNRLRLRRLPGGVSGQAISWGLVVRNLVLIAALPLVAADSAARNLVWIDYLTVACASWPCSACMPWPVSCWPRNRALAP